MAIYAIVNTKGGVSKTTTAIHLATIFSRTGKTLLIDGDPQASAASWAAWRRETNFTQAQLQPVYLGKPFFLKEKNSRKAIKIL